MTATPLQLPTWRPLRWLIPLTAAALAAWSISLIVWRLSLGPETWGADWGNLVTAATSADPYAQGVGFRWSPVAAWLLVPIVAAGPAVWAAAHFAVLPMLRDWRSIAIVLLFYPFWFDVMLGNALTFVFVAAWLALSGSRWATWTFYAMTVLMPRPLMLPVTAWLLWQRPESRLPFAAIFVVHAALVALSGFGDEWLTRLIVTPGGEMTHPGQWAPTRLIGWAWVPIGAALAVWFTWRGRLGLASVVIQPYLFAGYFLMVLLQLAPVSGQLPRLQGRVRADRGIRRVPRVLRPLQLKVAGRRAVGDETLSAQVPDSADPVP